MGADDRHNPGSPVESLYSFNRHLLSAGCVLGPTSGYGSKLIETSKTPHFPRTSLAVEGEFKKK